MSSVPAGADDHQKARSGLLGMPTLTIGVAHDTGFVAFAAQGMRLRSQARGDVIPVVSENSSMRISHVSATCPDTTYDIESDRFGNYTIRVGGRVIKRVTSVSDYLGKPKWGSTKLELNAIEDAKAAIERFRSPTG